MSTKDPNMKVIFGSDTKDFEKGANAVKQGLKDLDKSSSSMLSSISNAFGVNTQKVEQMTSAVRGLGYKLVETGNSGAKALGSILAKIGPLTAGIAGLGKAVEIGFKTMEEDREKIHWNKVKTQMREAWFERLCEIENLPIVVDYRNTRIQNRPSDMESLYRWVNSFQGNEKEIARIACRIREETALFEKEDVPAIMELARLGVRAPKPLRLT